MNEKFYYKKQKTSKYNNKVYNLQSKDLPNKHKNKSIYLINKNTRNEICIIKNSLIEEIDIL